MHMDEPDAKRLVDRLALAAATGRKRAHGAAMVGAVAADDLVFAGVAALLMVLPRQLHGGLGRLRAPAQEFERGDPWRRHL